MLFLCKASTVLEKQTQNEMLFIKIHPENMKDVLEYVRKDVLEYVRKDVFEYVRKAQPVKHKQKTKKVTFYQKSIDHKKQKLYHTICQEMKGNTNKLLYAQNAQRTIVTISYESTPYCYVTKYRKIPQGLS
jgi:hypothetical protein